MISCRFARGYKTARARVAHTGESGELKDDSLVSMCVSKGGADSKVYLESCAGDAKRQKWFFTSDNKWLNTVCTRERRWGRDEGKGRVGACVCARARGGEGEGRACRGGRGRGARLVADRLTPHHFWQGSCKCIGAAPSKSRLALVDCAEGLNFTTRVAGPSSGPNPCEKTYVVCP